MCHPECPSYLVPDDGKFITQQFVPAMTATMYWDTMKGTPMYLGLLRLLRRDSYILCNTPLTPRW